MKLERLMPRLRPGFLVSKLQQLRREDFDSDQSFLRAQAKLELPSQPTISRLCAIVGLSSQRIQAVKHSCLRATFPAEQQHLLQNVNKFPIVGVLDEVGCQRKAVPRKGMAPINEGGPQAVGDVRGTSTTYVVFVVLDL